MHTSNCKGIIYQWSIPCQTLLECPYVYMYMYVYTLQVVTVFENLHRGRILCSAVGGENMLLTGGDSTVRCTHMASHCTPLCTSCTCMQCCQVYWFNWVVRMDGKNSTPTASKTSKSLASFRPCECTVHVSTLVHTSSISKEVFHMYMC